MTKDFKNTDEYIATFPAATQVLLEQVRAAIKEVAPDAQECISYQMPAFKLHRTFIYFAGYSKHIGLYPTGTGIAAFQSELSAYKSSKGAVQFPLDKPLPLDLIKRIASFKLEEDKINAALKAEKKKKS